MGVHLWSKHFWLCQNIVLLHKVVQCAFTVVHCSCNNTNCFLEKQLFCQNPHFNMTTPMAKLYHRLRKVVLYAFTVMQCSCDSPIRFKEKELSSRNPHFIMATPTAASIMALSGHSNAVEGCTICFHSYALL